MARAEMNFSEIGGGGKSDIVVSNGITKSTSDLLGAFRLDAQTLQNVIFDTDLTEIENYIIVTAYSDAMNAKFSTITKAQFDASSSSNMIQLATYGNQSSYLYKDSDGSVCIKSTYNSVFGYIY